jgi:hypothetical protein
VEAVESQSPVRSRRRSSRSAKSPAVSVQPVALQPIAPEPVKPELVAPELVSPQLLAPEPVAPEPVAAQPERVQSPPQPATVADVATPVVHGRRKRARVMAPAGPPPPVSEALTSDEFDS